MPSCLVHTGDESVTLSAATVKRLLDRGDGDAALLYLALLRRQGTVPPRSLAGELRWDRGRIEAAETALRELENAGLITRIRQGWNQANRIFLQIPDRVQVSSRPEGNICPMDVQDSSPCMGQKLPTSNTDTEYKEHSKTEKVESTRRRYGEFQNVFLSGEECTRLEAAYPGKAAEYIERLSRYMASNDRHYANHYATIKKWLDEDSKGRSAKNYTYDDNEGECL